VRTKAFLGLIILLLPLLAACEDDRMTDAIYDIKRRNEARLMAMPGVVSVGIGRDTRGKPAIVVGLEDGASATAAKVPKEINGYPVVVQTVGQLKAQ
jgi:hypothetical protein